MTTAAAVLFCTGFFKKDKDGNIGVDTSGIEKQANDATAKASAEMDKAKKQADTVRANAAEKAKKAAESITVKKEEIIADLDKNIDEIKTKVAGMDTAKLIAYANTYGDVFADTQNKINEYTAQVKDLKFKEKFSAKGKELKNQLSTYKGRFDGLKEQCKLYTDKLESYGMDLSAYGLDLSAYGL
jgi:uncharacterized coiled-coil DUF342 family protein